MGRERERGERDKGGGEAERDKGEERQRGGRERGGERGGERETERETKTETEIAKTVFAVDKRVYSIRLTSLSSFWSDCFCFFLRYEQCLIVDE